MAGALLISPMLAAPAWAGETVIGFDHFPGGEAVPAGTVVGSQWAVEGLKLGKAESLGVPKMTLGIGDCGSPTVQKEAVPGLAFSSPNYAVLEKCQSDPASPYSSGTFGQLLGQGRGSLSAQVRNFTVGGLAPKVRLTAYNSVGEAVASEEALLAAGGWTHVAVAPAGGAKTISYFSIVAAESNTNEIAVDDIRFEAPPPPVEEPKSTPPSPPKPTPTTAQLALATPNPQAGQLLMLTGAGSTAGGGGRIISYGWNFRGGPNVETSTGTNPVAHLMLGPGAHTIALTVTNSNGEKSTSRFGVTLPPTKIHPPDGGQGECMPTLEIGDARLLAECIQKLSGGYVISGELEINGMSVVPKSGGFLKIRTIKQLGIGTFTQLYGAQVNFELRNTPIGDMVIGGRDLEAEPLNLDVQSALAHFGGPIYHGFSAPRARVADKPAKTLLMAVGVGKECGAGESKKAGCCPPKNGLTACGTLPGNFPLTGQVDVYLTNNGQALFDAQVGLSLKEVNFEATGALEIRANLETGIELSSLQFEIGEASLAPIFKVTKASFVYYFPEYVEESKRDSWQAKGTITFGEEIAQMEAELAFKKGNFQSASMRFTANPGVPIYPGVALNEIGASVGVNPLAFGGSLGAKIAELLELELAFKFREATSTELGFFGGQGKLSYKSDEIATLAADVYTDGYIDAQVTFNLHIPFDSKEPVIEVSGGAGFWDEPASGLWQARGNVYMKLWILSAEVAALINNQYAAGCLHVGAEGIFGGGVQGRYRFSDGNISGGLFGNDNCSDQLKQYSQKPLVKHTGGFVKEEGALFLPRPGAAFGGSLDSVGGALAAAMRAQGSAGNATATGPRATQAGAESDTFTLPNGTLGQELRITSTAGTPVVALLGPGGQTYTTPLTAGHLVTVPGQFMSAVAPDPHQVLVLLRHPKGGAWRIQAMPGSAPIATLETAEDVPPATVRVHVGHRRGRHFSLAYRIAHFVAGTHVRFVERGKDSVHVLGTVGKAKGTLSFVPGEALARSRTVLAYLVNGEGIVVRELTVGHYSAPAALRPGRVRKLRFVRRGAGALLTWAAVAGAHSYRIKVRGSDGRLQTFFRKAGRRSVAIANVLPFESFTAIVISVSGHEVKGGSASITLRAKKLPRIRVPRGKRRKKR